MSTTIRVPDRTRDRLAALANATGRTMTAVVDDALDALERRVFFEALNTRYGELREDDVEWEAVEAERAVEAGAARDRSKPRNRSTSRARSK
jgi:predicted transcriptional regulator